MSVLILGWGLVRLAAPANCINSTFVQKIDIVDGEQKISLTACTPYTRLFGPVITEDSPALDVISRLEKFEKAAFVWQRPAKLLSVKVTNGKDLTLDEDAFTIGRRFLSTGDFELALLNAIHSQYDPVTREVVARLFLHLLKPREPALGVWTAYLRTLAGYCESDHLLVHREFCLMRQELGDGLIADENDDSAISWSLMPLLDDTLRFAFQQTDRARWSEFIERSLLLGAFDDDSLFEGVTDIRGLDERYLTLLRLWLMPLIPDETVIKAIEERSSILRQKYVYIVNQTDDELALARGRQRAAIVEHGAVKLFAPSDVGLNLSRQDLFTHLDIEEVVVIGCKMPKPRRLLEFAPWMKTVYFVQKCEDEIDVDLADLVEEGALALALRQPESKVFEFNLRSLRVAQKINGPLKGHTFKDWREWLGWRGQTADRHAAFLRPLAIFDAITRFTPASEKPLSRE